MADETGIKFPDSLTGFVPEKLIGAGGFGHVWLAQQKNFNRPVAIKVGRLPLIDSDSALRFERECAALGRLTGKPHIVDVYTSGLIDGGVPYLVMEYVAGGTLRSHGSDLSEATLMSSMLQLCKAIQSAHDAEILHRDLKPENVFRRHNGEIVVGDFGIARLADREHTSDGIPATLMYAAPEILEGEKPTFRSDVYGIGVTMASALLGRSPFDLGPDASTGSVIARVLEGSTSAIDRTQTAPHLADAINLAMMRDPMRRPATASDLANLLAVPSEGVTTGYNTPRFPTQRAEIAASTSKGSLDVLAKSGGAPTETPANSGRTAGSKWWLAVGVLGVCLASFAIFLGLSRVSVTTTTAESALPESLVETTPPTPTVTTTEADPAATEVNPNDGILSGASAPVALEVSEYSFPIELAAGNGCQPGSDQLPDGIWFVTLPNINDSNAGDSLNVNLVCAFDATAIKASGFETDFEGWIFEDRLNTIRVLRVASGLDQSGLQDERAYRIQVSSSILVSIDPAG